MFFLVVNSILKGPDPRKAIQKTWHLCCFGETGLQPPNYCSMRPTLSTIERDAIIARLGADGLLACQCLVPASFSCTSTYLQVHS